MQGLPHAPCRLQRKYCDQVLAICLFASTRSVQIATFDRKTMRVLDVFASTRSVQIATAEMHRIAIYTFSNVC